MKVWLAAILAAIALATEAVCETAAISFDHAGLIINRNALTTEYTGFDSIVIGRGISLAAKAFAIELAENESISAIRFSSDAENLGSFAATDLLHDVTTSDDTKYDSLFRRYPLANRPGFAAGFVSNVLRLEGKRYATVLVFPVSLNTDGSAVSNKSIAVTVGTRCVDAQQMIPREMLIAAHDWSREAASPSASTGAQIDYVIITDSSLFESFLPLARYKNETGLATDIHLMEDIRTSYAGRDDGERLREYLQDFYAQGGRYVLLGGDETIVPVRYAYNFDTDTMVPPNNSRSAICTMQT